MKWIDRHTARNVSGTADGGLEPLATTVKVSCATDYTNPLKFTSYRQYLFRKYLEEFSSCLSVYYLFLKSLFLIPLFYLYAV